MSSRILLGHGSGGRLMHKLINDLLLKKLDNPFLSQLADSARIDCKGSFAFTTDSFVVSPLKFPGADIGKLSVCGTVNDLVMLAANPQYLSLGLIIEEGLKYSLLEDIVDSIARTAKQAKVYVVTGDIKVVEKGACDKIFINTSGIGLIIPNRDVSAQNISSGDQIIFTGNIAQHGIAVLAKRQALGLKMNIRSDCAALNGLIIPILKKSCGVKFMRDPTRGGIATTLNEITQSCQLGVLLEEADIPVSPGVRAACELLGIDPLYVACEGVAIMIVQKKEVKNILNLLRKHPLGKNARIVGKVTQQPKQKVILNTIMGTKRVLDMLTSEPLPRIC